LAEIRTLTITVASEASDGESDIRLEAQWDLPDTPVWVAVLCHPHPQQRGTMNAPLMSALTSSLVNRDFAVLRFNFRGVGASTGEHDFGRGEMDDVAASVARAAVAYPGLPIGVAGWSFGAATSLRWHSRDRSRLAWVGIAPPVDRVGSPSLPTIADLAPAKRTLILGDRDQFATVEAMERYAAEIGADLRVLKGSDHFFYFREERVAEWVAAGFTEEEPAP